MHVYSADISEPQPATVPLTVRVDTYNVDPCDADGSFGDGNDCGN